MMGVVLLVISILFFEILYQTNTAVNKPLKKVVQAFGQVQEGNLEIRIFHKPQDEFQYIYSSFNRMVERIQELIENVKEQGRLLQNAELMQLQSQINPHFLYNSFYLIRIMAKNESYDQIIQFVTSLAKYYRFLNKEVEQNIPLSREVEHMENYIDIQQMRFGDKITVHKGQLPESAAGFLVPKLILQPVIENAYNYGMSDILKDGQIAISYSLKEPYLCIVIEDNGGGAGAEISFTYFEKFTKGIDQVKRDDYINGEIGQNGQRDTIVLDGGSLLYEPFWYRTMRFLKIEIQAAGEEVRFYRPALLKTGYPLNPGSYIKSDAPWVEKVYDMCVRTLQGCMMETYMDCPFWEQMQYPMDTRLQALFTYVCSADTKLAEKALRDFHDSMLPMGLIQGRAPSNPKQIISTFSLYYIFMLLEYYRRTGDTDILKRYRADVDSILEYYDRHLGPQGLVENLGYWDFVDWQESWHDTMGRPAAVRKGPSTIINLMYGLALLDGAEINEATGRSGLAQEYRERQKNIADQIQNLCWDAGRGMFREGPSCQEFSQHAQSWAVLNGMLSGEEARRVMRRTFEEKDVLRCYFSTCYELFRACEKAGCYELTARQMDWWIKLLEEHCTTCPETPSNSRSECHAWSALPMYELISVMGGIRREAGSPARVEVCPHLDYVPNLEGGMLTEYGLVTFRYYPKDGGMQYELALPEGMEGSFRGANGGSAVLRAGKNEIWEPVKKA